MTEKVKKNIGTVAQKAIRAGKTNEQALEAVKAEFPDAKTSLASINWYRQQLRSAGESVPTARELSAKKKGGKKSAAKDPLA